MSTRYYVYRNLHKKCWSLKKDGKVISHHEWLMFDGTEHSQYFGFRVSEAGRQRVIREKRKNVHAFCWGWYPVLEEEHVKDDLQHAGALIQVTYNPYQAGYFKEVVTGKEVVSGLNVFFTPKGLFVSCPIFKEDEST